MTSITGSFRETSQIAVSKGYKYTTTPLFAFNMDYMRAYIEVACATCQDVSCGCPSHLAWHFYASDCRPEELGGYDDFQNKLDASAKLMEDYPFLKGAIVNEVGMLNCYQDGPDGGCIPNGAQCRLGNHNVSVRRCSKPPVPRCSKPPVPRCSKIPGAAVLREQVVFADSRRWTVAVLLRGLLGLLGVVGCQKR